MAVESPVHAGKKTHLLTTLQSATLLSKSMTATNPCTIFNALEVRVHLWNHPVTRRLRMFGGPRCLLWKTTMTRNWYSMVLDLLYAWNSLVYYSILIHFLKSFALDTSSDQTNNHDVVDVFCHVMTGSFWDVALLILSNKLSRWHSPNERTASQWKGSQVKVFDSNSSNQVYSSLLCGTHLWGLRSCFLLWSHLHLKVLISEKENDACAVINIRTWPDRKWSAGNM